MIGPLSKEDKQAIRRCLHYYISLARKLRDGEDVTEDLKDEFERSRFSPVYLLARAEARAKHAPACRVCSMAEDVKRSGVPLIEVAALNNYQTAAEYYLGLGPGVVENQQLLDALGSVIVSHWRALHLSTQTRPCVIASPGRVLPSTC